MNRIGWMQRPAKAVLSPLFKFAWRVEVDGAANIPRRGPAILAPNHTSVLDSFFVPLTLARSITYVGKAEYMEQWTTKSLFPAMGMIPIDRSGGEASARALDAAAGVLDGGDLFGIYPEGTRSRDGVLHKGHTGVARLALRTGAPIVPVGLIGTVDVQPPDERLPRLFREVTVRFGTPIDVTRYRDRANDRLILRQITDEVMYEIRQLSGQQYVNTYATRQPSGVPPVESPLGTGPVAVVTSDLVEPTRRPPVTVAPSPGPRPARRVEPIADHDIDDTSDLEDARSSADVLGSPAPLVDLTF